MTRVRCYAGTSYPERPVSFEWEGCWLDVSEVIRQARTPEKVVFWVLAENGVCYQLSWLAATDEWAAREQPSSHRLGPPGRVGAGHEPC